ncbi:MAG: HlyD family efflux transporter periplasmic adaptor subunit [Pseudomonadota bacterium]
MQKELFRKEVFEAKSATVAQFGKPSITTPLSWRWFLLIIILTLAFACFFIVAFEFPRTATANGRLVHEKKAVRVHTDRRGIIDEVFVRDGDSVEEGTPLFSIRRYEGLSNGVEYGPATQEALDAQLIALEERRLAVNASADVRVQQLESQRDAALTDMARETQSVKWLNERNAELARRTENYRGFLAEGLVAEPNLEAQIDAFQLNRQNLLDAKTRLSGLRALLPDLDLRIEQVRIETKQEIAAIQERIAIINGQKNQAKFDDKFLILAPADGIVNTLQAQPGLQTHPDQLVLLIAPHGSELIAEILIHASAIAFIAPDQNVRLTFSAFPQQRSYRAYGIVRSVSATTLSSSELGGAAPQGVYYKAIIELNSQYVPAFGRNVSLQSGMEVTANIVLEQRKVIHWLLDTLRGET